MENQVQIHTIKDIETMANVVARSGLFGVKDPTQALALMLLCQAEGLHPMAACRQYHVIQGRASMTSQTMMSRFLQVGGKQEIHAVTDEVADVTLTHPAGGSVRIVWTIDNARKCGLAGKDNWKNHPRSMLLRRAQAEGVRAVAPFILEGLPHEDEAVEIEQPLFTPAPKPPIDVDNLPPLTSIPEPELVEFDLNGEWPKEIKARVAKEVKKLDGRITSTGKAVVSSDRAQEFSDYLVKLEID